MFWDFIQRAPSEMARAVYAAQRERSVGLGLMGTILPAAQGAPLESAAKAWNIAMFKHIRKGAMQPLWSLRKNAAPA